MYVKLELYQTRYNALSNFSKNSTPYFNNILNVLKIRKIELLTTFFYFYFYT